MLNQKGMFSAVNGSGKSSGEIVRMLLLQADGQIGKIQTLVDEGVTADEAVVQLTAMYRQAENLLQNEALERTAAAMSY